MVPGNRGSGSRNRGQAPELGLKVENPGIAGRKGQLGLAGFRRKSRDRIQNQKIWDPGRVMRLKMKKSGIRDRDQDSKF